MKPIHSFAAIITSILLFIAGLVVGLRLPKPPNQESLNAAVKSLEFERSQNQLIRFNQGRR